jgi:hypothetical protein
MLQPVNHFMSFSFLKFGFFEVQEMHGVIRILELHGVSIQKVVTSFWLT